MIAGGGGGEGKGREMEGKGGKLGEPLTLDGPGTVSLRGMAKSLGEKRVAGDKT